MGLETASYISQLNTANPTGSDNRKTADDHLRLLKTVLQTQFPSLGAAAVNATATQMNYLVGVTSGIQTQFTGKADIASPTFTGTPAAPTASLGTNTTQLANCAFVQTAISNVNANGALTLATDAGASVSGAAGQHTVCTNASAVTFTLPASPSNGNKVRVAFTNTLYTNVIDPGAEKIRGATGARTVNAKNADVEFVYTGASFGWSF
ncbi:MAG: hypothetical protein RLZZ182_641 [Pseudomonadota bacterium]|jgi:hypothetical protein